MVRNKILDLISFISHVELGNKKVYFLHVILIFALIVLFKFSMFHFPINIYLWMTWYIQLCVYFSACLNEGEDFFALNWAMLKFQFSRNCKCLPLHVSVIVIYSTNGSSLSLFDSKKRLYFDYDQGPKCNMFVAFTYVLYTYSILPNDYLKVFEVLKTMSCWCIYTSIHCLYDACLL